MNLRGPLNLFTSRRARRILLIVLAGLVAWWLVAWIAARALIVSAELPSADAVVVLAGSSGYMERTHLAAKLFQEGRAPEIILTNDTEQGGWSNELQRNPFFIELAAAELTRAGVPESKIQRLEKAVSSTHDEALLLRDYAAQRGLRSLLIVTSAYHSRRALWTFRRVFAGSGVEIGLSFVAPGEQSPSPATWWLQPRGWNLVAAEYVKLIYYRLAY